MKRAGTRLGVDQDLARTGVAVLGGVRVGQDTHLVDGVQRRRDVDVDQRGRRHVVHAIDGVGRLFRGSSTDDQRGLAKVAGVDLRVGAVGAGDAGHERRKLLEVATVEHQVGDLLGGDGAPAFGRFRLHSDDVSLHGHLGLHAANHELDVLTAPLSWVQMDVRNGGLLEAIL